MAAAYVVGLADRLVPDFDALVDRYGLEKIKTIGDAYMVASGVPRRRPDHARALATMALEMLDLVATHRRDDGAAIELRIGINPPPAAPGAWWPRTPADGDAGGPGAARPAVVMRDQDGAAPCLAAAIGSAMAIALSGVTPSWPNSSISSK